MWKFRCSKKETLSWVTEIIPDQDASLWFRLLFRWSSCFSTGIFLHLWSEIKGKHSFFSPSQISLFLFLSSNTNQRFSAPHLELLSDCISSEVLRPQRWCNIKLITSALEPSLCSPTVVCFQNHRFWNDLNTLYWPPTHHGPLLLGFLKITFCVGHLS